MGNERKNTRRILSRLTAVALISLPLVCVAQSANSTIADSLQPQNSFGMKLTGFIDASYLNNLESSKSTFGFNQAEVDIQRPIEQIGEFRIDLEMTNGQSDEFDYTAEQGYIMLSPSTFGQSKFVFGKFNAPIGFEGADPVDLFQSSYGLIAENCLPGNLTGLMISSQLGSAMGLSLHVSNGWDNNFDSNNKKTVGGQFNYALGEKINFALAAIRGADSDSSEDMLSVYDFNLGFNPVKNLLIGGEINFGEQTGSGQTGQWRGALLMSHVGISDHFGVTGRYDYLQDRDGICFGNDLNETRQAVTFAATYNAGNGLASVAEYRFDLSDYNVFESNGDQLSKHSSNLTFEMIYEF
jgi:hypothetical protein